MPLDSIVTSILGTMAQPLLQPTSNPVMSPQPPGPFLQVLATCSEPTVDIVCIPDRYENPLKDWTEIDDSRNVNWLTDLLPVSFPHARILLYRYETDETALQSSVDVMSEKGYHLLYHLWMMRRETAEERPLLFLVNGSGIFLARSAIIQSSAGIADDTGLRSIYLSTGSILMLDTLKHRKKPWRTYDDFFDDFRDKNISVFDNSTSREEFKWVQDRFRAIASTIDTTIIVLRRDSGSGVATGQRSLPTASKYKNVRFLGEHGRVADLEKTGDSLTKFRNIEDADYQDLISHLSNSMEIGSSLCAAKWIRYASQMSSSVIECGEGLLEAGKEYERQLEQTALRGQEWYLQIKPDSPSFHRHTHHFTYRPIYRPIYPPDSVYRERDLYLNDLYDSSSERDSPERDSPERDSPERDPHIFAQIAVLTPREKFKLAEDLLYRIENNCGSSHARTLESLNDLAILCLRQGICMQELPEEEAESPRMFLIAESIMQRLLVSWESIFGSQSAKVLYALRRLGTIKEVGSGWQDAQPYWVKEIDLRSKLLVALENKVTIDSKRPGNQQEWPMLGGLEDKIQQQLEAIARCRIELAVLYDKDQKYKDAEALYDQVLQSARGQTIECQLLCLEKQADHWVKTGALSKAANNYATISQAWPHWDLWQPIEYRLKAVEKRIKETSFRCNPIKATALFVEDLFSRGAVYRSGR